MQVLEIIVGRLKRQGVLYAREAKSLSKFMVLKAREAFRQDPPRNLQVREVAYSRLFCCVIMFYHDECFGFIHVGATVHSKCKELESMLCPLSQPSFFLHGMIPVLLSLHCVCASIW